MKPRREPAPSALDRYCREIARHPVLSADEERALARAGGAARAESLRRLVLANLRFVVRMALRYRSARASVLDLVQEGNIGLMKAVERFDPERNVRLLSYAAPWIRAGMLAHLARAEPVERDAAPDGLAGDEAPSSLAEEPIDPRPPADELLACHEEEVRLRRRVREALARLDRRERFIVEGHAMSDAPASLSNLGAELRISAERTRQLAVRAARKLRAELTAEFGQERAVA
jgi:RNA polymerase sigma-32 factor